MSILLFETLCRLCKHRQGYGCAAYPEGIPLEIRLMHVDHRHSYPGDQGILFEPKDDSETTRERLAKVAVRKGRIPAGVNALDQRISKVAKKLPFKDEGEGRRFSRCVTEADSFEQLPEWCQRLIEDAEVESSAENGSGERRAPERGRMVQ